MLRRAGVDGVDFGAPPGELHAGDVGVGHFVDDVVDLAAERVERADRRAPRPPAAGGSCSRSSSRFARPSARNIRPASCGAVADALPARARAREERPVARCAAPGAGVNTSPRTASMRSRMRCRRRPPRQARAPSRQGRRADQRPASSNSARVRAVSNAMRRVQRVVAHAACNLRERHAEALEVLERQVERGPCANRSRRPARSWRVAAPCRSHRFRASACASSTPYSASRSRPTGFAERRQ